ncbi:MAG: membrane-bound alpha-1,6- mannosyltransferase Initiation-specific [Thelocarpon superellum]|nr:MAG: membrane-bound alpha-1,6- mannosyltransferase Initiation-specific [Thelocarpon superellum]
MISFRRALLLALCLLTLVYFFRSSHSSHSSPLSATAVHDQAQPDAEPAHGSEVDSAPKGSSTGPAQGVSDLSASEWKAKTMTPHVKDGKQQTMTDMTGKSLTEQLRYQFPYDVEGKFPGYIWQTWKVTPGSGEFLEKFRIGEASWTEKHPGFVHEVITDQVAVHLIRHLYAAVPAVLDAYKALPLAIMKADFFRYLILLARGGIYTDIDTIAIKSAPEWVPDSVPRSSFGLVVGIEADPDRPDWADWYSRRIQFCQWTIQSKPGHPVLREVVAAITEETLKRKREGTLTKDMDTSIVEFTGPALWTDQLFAFFNNPDYFEMTGSRANISFENFTGMKEGKRVGDVIVLPITSFSPGVKTMGAGDEDDPMAFVKHDFEGTWKPDSERHIGEIYD